MIKDALLEKLGTVKVWTENETREDKEKYYNVTEDVMAVLLQKDAAEIEITGLSPSQEMEGTFDVEVTNKITNKRHRVAPVPPNEFGWSRRTGNSIQETDYCYHEPEGGRSIAELVEQGYDRKMLDDLPKESGISRSSESRSRDTVNDSDKMGGSDDLNKIMRRVSVCEHYVRMDYKGDGKSCLYKVTTASEETKILTKKGEPDIEEVDVIPFACITPYIVTHRLCGRSAADLVMDIQKIKTALTRGLLDNIYLTLNPRVEVSEANANENTLDDLLISRPGGIVRTKTPGGLNPFVHPDITGSIYPMLQYMDSTREWRTGVTRQGQGLDADALNNQTATAAMQFYDVAQARMKLVARTFAETGIADLFWLLHRTIRKNGEQQMTIRMRNKWVTIDPRNWKDRNDMTVNVGLGHGGKAEQMQQMLVLINAQREAAAGMMGMVKPINFYNSARDLVRLLDKKDIDRYFVQPQPEAEMPTPPDPNAAKAQIEQAKGQAQMQIEQGKLQAKQQSDQMKAATDAQMAQMKASIEQQKAVMTAQVKQMEANHKVAIEKLQAEADIAVGQAKAAAQMQIAQQKHALEVEKVKLEAQLEVHKHMLDTRFTEQKHTADLAIKQQDAQNKQADFKARSQERRAMARSKPKAK
jgi:predicted HTH domain antitoxin